MKEFLDKSAFIKIRSGENSIFFYAKKVTSITDTHIVFIDKFDDLKMFLLTDVIQIEELREDAKSKLFKSGEERW